MITQKPFYFLRHGETEHNVKPVFSKEDSDMGLNINGVEQAQRMSSVVKKLPIKLVYHSPLIRAVQTAEIVLYSHQRTSIDELKECSVELWLSMNRAVSQKQPFCEGVEAFFSQVTLGINRCLEGNELPLIVAHGGVHFALCHLLNIQNHPKAIANCTLVLFEPSGSQAWGARVVNP